MVSYQGITRKDLVSGYFFYGEETFPAYQFIDDVKISLFSQEKSEQFVEKFYLESSSWPEIIDSARMVSLLSPHARLIIVESPARKKPFALSPQEKLSDLNKKLMREYFSDPVTGTVIVTIFPGKIKKSSALIKFFSSLPDANVKVLEQKPLRENKLIEWAVRRLSQSGKTAEPDAIERLLELAGNDLRRINNEIEKILTYIADKKQVELDDIHQITGSVKIYVEWEISQYLEKADFKNCLLIIDRLLVREGIPPVNIIGVIAGFFQDLLMAKLRLKEGQKSRKEIFREIKPQILETFGDLYRNQFRQLFLLVDIFSFSDLRVILEKLRMADLKTTNLKFQALIEAFLFEYCWFRKKKTLL